MHQAGWSSSMHSICLPLYLSLCPCVPSWKFVSMQLWSVPLSYPKLMPHSCVSALMALFGRRWYYTKTYKHTTLDAPRSGLCREVVFVQGYIWLGQNTSVLGESQRDLCTQVSLLGVGSPRASIFPGFTVILQEKKQPNNHFCLKHLICIEW